jgi:hypothetical protein
MSREEEEFVDAIERFTGKGIPRVILPHFDYRARGGEARRGERGARPARPARTARVREREPESEVQEPASADQTPAPEPSYGRSRMKVATPGRRRR